MDKQSDLLMNLSVLYRSTQKYYDRMLPSIDLTYAQLPVLILIYEQEGISSNEIASHGVYDKGTISKTVKHLEQHGFIYSVKNEEDKRNKNLYTTDYAKQIMSMVYDIRRDWWHHLIADVNPEHFDYFLECYDQMSRNAKAYADSEPTDIHFFDWQKVSLSSYQDHVSTVLYTAGDNFRCPYYTRPELVFVQEDLEEIPLDTIKTYLKQRQGILEAVCIEGGEPFMNNKLEYFLEYVKALGYKTKVHTNGTFPEALKRYIDKGLLDFVSLELKNGPKEYAKCIGMEGFDVSPITKSLSILQQSGIDYQTEIYLVKGYHSQASIAHLTKWIEGVKKIVVHTQIDGSKTIIPGLLPLEKDQLEKCITHLKEKIPVVQVEG